jgi:hypothetical protein
LSIETAEEIVEKLDRATSILGEALIDLQIGMSPAPVTEDAKTQSSMTTKPSLETELKGMPSPLVETIRRLKRCTRQIEIIRYLWNRQEREAELRLIAIDVFKVREASLLNRTRSVRRQLERTRDNLESAECPLRLFMNANSIQLVSAPMSP